MPGLVSAQTVDSYRLNYFNAGAAQPFQQTDAFPASAAQCNQAAPPVDAQVVNPNTAVWNDPANAGRVCVFALPTSGALASLPIPGSYEGTLTAINRVGVATSARAPFSREGVPAAPTGLRLIR